MKGVFLIVMALFLFSCGGVQLPTKTQVEVGAKVGCALMTDSCFNDESVQAAFPGLERSSCEQRLVWLFDIVTNFTDPPRVPTKEELALVALDIIDLDEVNPAKLSGLSKAKCSYLKGLLGVK